jgi:hypothetical protein
LETGEMAQRDYYTLNPFTVQTPEDITAEEAKSLFVDVFTDFYKVPLIGHTFLHGPRGSGKSMMFRYLRPDCQQLVMHCKLAELPFFAVYIPIKNTDLRITELDRLTAQYGDTILNEHLLCMYVATKAFKALADTPLDDYNGRECNNAVRKLSLAVDDLLQHYYPISIASLIEYLAN